MGPSVCIYYVEAWNANPFHMKSIFHLNQYMHPKYVAYPDFINEIKLYYLQIGILQTLKGWNKT